MELEKVSLCSQAGIPDHVALIMDGNGRWAAQRELPRLEGHRAGAEALRKIVLKAPQMGIQYLTVYAFSTENWRRNPEEINGLMSLLESYSNSELEEIKKNGINVNFIGDLTKLELEVREQLNKLADETKDGDKLILTVAINYGGRAELTKAVQRIVSRVQCNELVPDEITENELHKHLMTAGIPDPDLVIRTSGEIRLSNFLLWQSAYAELEFVDTLWPDFTPAFLQSILNRYSTRSRRFGANGK